MVFVHPVRVLGHSMEPSLKDGSIQLALRSWCAGTPAQGEVWVVESPDGPAVKRVIGLPGDHLEQRDGELFLNGQRMVESYLAQYDRGDVHPWDAGSGYLVLGDNRRQSRDSRAWGPLPRASLSGRILGL
jgi:signal peptidase I